MAGQDHIEIISGHNEKFNQLEKSIGLIQSFNQKMVEVTADQSASLKRIHERLDDWNEQTKAIIQLGTSVEHMVEESKKTQESVGEAMKLIQDLNLRTRDIEMKKYEDQFTVFEQRVATLENKPGAIALKYIDKAFTYLLIAFLGFIIFAISYYMNRA